MSSVAKSRDPRAVQAMFDGIASRYDLANHLLSGGIDYWWRHRAATIVEKWQPVRILDLATGSGDLALAIKRRLPQAHVTGVDFSPEMLANARRKGLEDTIVADALQLPFADGSFDCVTVAFGLRNMADWGAAVREMARVLTRESHLLILDFSMPGGALQPAYRFYLHRCLPTLAALVTRRRDAYEYLGASIEKFPAGAAMTSLIEANGLASATATRLTGGIATIYLAQKL
ncbi:MAG: bifunctional demethylmenaquinone methyltransferase/2-methoxy-6-polyprenyl-1,4-benzoquinol methylase UbiE [Verrucomicrobiota bacterium]|nr:bifunctional demethylmenaquinone methyltransferase/2-methoxy-6-polyprenyl-1,4-benzoquinol methylase UbiE [Verrucomicrobiota bacterium]